MNTLNNLINGLSNNPSLTLAHHTPPKNLQTLSHLVNLPDGCSPFGCRFLGSGVCLSLTWLSWTLKWKDNVNVISYTCGLPAMTSQNVNNKTTIKITSLLLLLLARQLYWFWENVIYPFEIIIHSFSQLHIFRVTRHLI